MRLVLLFGSVVLLACGQPPASHSDTVSPQTATPAAPQTYDYTGPSGIRISFDTDAPRYFSAPECERAYNDAMACMGIQAHGPVVRVVKNPIVIDGREYSGFTDFTTGQVTLVSCSVAPHEFVHYLLWNARYPNSQNAAHDADGFERCGAPLTSPSSTS